MEKYSKYFLLDVGTVKEYVKEKVGYFGKEEELEAIEIGEIGRASCMERVSLR